MAAEVIRTASAILSLTWIAAEVSTPFFDGSRMPQQAETIRREPPPMPGNGPYRVAIADVPWPYEDRQADPTHRGARPYPTMTIQAICDKGPEVQAIMHQDAIMWFWITNFHMRFAFDVLDAWGFE